jgi:hypothetical protein
MPSNEAAPNAGGYMDGGGDMGGGGCVGGGGYGGGGGGGTVAASGEKRAASPSFDTVAANGTDPKRPKTSSSSSSDGALPSDGPTGVSGQLARTGRGWCKNIPIVSRSCLS